MQDKPKFQRENQEFPENWPINTYIRESLLHRSIRRFEPRPVEEEVISMLQEVASRASTSTGMQQASWIRITDRDLAREIAQVCKQEYVASMPELWIFIVDLYRNYHIGESHGFAMPEITSMNRFFSGYRDAIVMAQAVLSAVESMHMGGVFLGSVGNEPLEIVKLLNLPKLTFPVLGLGFGYVGQDPQLKPRIPVALKSFENQYHIPEDYLETFRAYDQEMTEYYDLRDENKREDSFTLQIMKKYGQLNIPRAKVLEDVEAQGFQLFVEE